MSVSEPRELKQTNGVVGENWFCVEMDHSSRSSFHRLCRQFQRAFMRAGAPESMALFARRNGSEGLPELYFTPGSYRYVDDLIQAHDGEPCKPPAGETITLLFGIPEAKTLLNNDRRAETTDPRS